MNITIKDKNIKIKGGFRAMMLFERILAESGENISSITSLVQYFWCCVISSKDGEDITYDEFVDWLDENPNEFTNFNEWMSKQNNLFPKKN